MENRAQLIMESRPQNAGLARLFVAAFIAPLDPSVETLTDVKTAVSEAVTNAVIHGYDSQPEGSIVLSLALEDGRLHIVVQDHGAGIPDVSQALMPLFTTRPEMERAGMGFTVMESFMDSVTVASTPGEGTTVEMVKQLG